ncbi:4-(cytidine 5'-diphospho)-2-C-methyl-D-erythritol kinase [Synechococcus sp. A10-1-5-1]|uniref:4-(cytidine 5'-diphospho)-2-C-methyl-D-erythritol kinase n=1 Tax=Synechococcus sp. A10-1-5-1 TaxID=2936507 RepID=UPI002001D2BE|nr:4-(cytidine 5'-diphospho)-2-C-methyl-D-erythritol kinase [Synechococcus sp. A10-1-5-1]UPM50435.1 4-(cytidine 5'-diphospho)-2-C-methyl-D-erythritol kinase [Synechococcus sp. A10-1-5-1]
MAELQVSTPAKINLHLEVLGLRPDGFHELAMVMQTLDLADNLSLRPTADGAVTLRCDRADLPTDGNNLIVKAAELIKQRVGLPELGVAMELTKRIPIGAGLAGGSSNGAAALVGLNTLWGCGFSSAQLSAMAAELGSDMPFCIDGGTQLCFGRGEVLESAGLAKPPSLGVLLIKHPDSSVSTPWAYKQCREQFGASYLSGEAEFEQRRRALRQAPLLTGLSGEGPLQEIRNDLQKVVEPEVASVREGLSILRRADAALAVSMSGSGPSMFALFADHEAATRAQQQLAAALEAAGFAFWVCRCTGSGATLV